MCLHVWCSNKSGTKGTNRPLIAAVIERLEGSGALQLEDAFETRITEECLSQYIVDGPMCKTVKSKFIESFNLEDVNEKPESYVGVVDLGLIWRLASPTSEEHESKRRHGTAYCWNDYLQKNVPFIFLAIISL